MHENDIAKEIVDSCVVVHKELGPGLLESIYVAALAMELSLRSLTVVTQQDIPVLFRGVELGLGFRADLVVEGKVVIEVKSVDDLASVHHKQLLTYLRVLDLKLGILVNFNSAVLTHNLKRTLMACEFPAGGKEFLAKSAKSQKKSGGFACILELANPNRLVPKTLAHSL